MSTLINPNIRVNASGINRLEARNTPVADSQNNITYDFLLHRSVREPYAGLILFKLPAVTAPAAAGNVYFTTNNGNSTQVYDYSGTPVASDNAALIKGGVFLGFYSDGRLQLLTGLSQIA